MVLRTLEIPVSEYPKHNMNGYTFLAFLGVIAAAYAGGYGLGYGHGYGLSYGYGGYGHGYGHGNHGAIVATNLQKFVHHAPARAHVVGALPRVKGNTVVIVGVTADLSNSLDASPRIISGHGCDHRGRVFVVPRCERHLDSCSARSISGCTEPHFGSSSGSAHSLLNHCILFLQVSTIVVSFLSVLLLSAAAAAAAIVFLVFFDVASRNGKTF
ncbi:hypothetical protein HPB51_018063 [Rhipicephalus microplus]|uniref:Uncharacterized protein n=1 Tax=Rhipicephalus microplus TaxID=6941 RepID=A0A9J6E2U0_RHIMP|nr:hypothetical protein HPB51_018063 [Rhipicephalus microplus]